MFRIVTFAYKGFVYTVTIYNTGVFVYDRLPERLKDREVLAEIAKRTTKLFIGECDRHRPLVSQFTRHIGKKIISYVK